MTYKLDTAVEQERLSEISFKDGDFQNLGIGKFDFSQICTMPVVHFVNREPRPLGTCFVIANDGLAITARHVVDEAFGPYFTTASTNVSIPESEALHAIYASNEIDPDTGLRIGRPLPIVKIWTNGGMDIAILQLSVPTDTRTGKKLRLPSLQLSPAVPKVGTGIIGFGYRRMKWKAREDGYNAAQRYTASKGQVQQIHFPRRDSVFMSFPCFETSARFDGGMSGGPIISTKGQVCGVICSSMKTDVSDDTFTSYGSLIAPAMALVLNGADSAGVERELFLHDFIRDGAVGVDQTFSEVRVQNTGREIFVDLGSGMTFRNKISAPR